MPNKVICFLIYSVVGLSTSLAQSDLSFKEKNYFSMFRMTIISEGGFTPALKLDNGEKIVAKYLTFLGFSYEQRLNLTHKLDNFSTSVSVPWRLNINIMDEALVPTFATGIYADANFHKGSTYNNVSLKGVQFGVGLDFEYMLGLNEVDYGITKPQMRASPMFKISITNAIDYAKHIDNFLQFKIGIPYKTDVTDDYGITSEKWANLRFAFYFNIPTNKR